MNLIVTGGAGFIGSNFIEYIMNKYPGCKVACVDKLTYAGSLLNLESVVDKPGFRFVKADICDREAMYSLFEETKPDAVVNFAAESHVDRSIDNPEVFLYSNYIGVGVLLDACVRCGNVRFHQISTDEVYGDLPISGSERFTESTRLNPSSPYSASKASADLLTLSYYKTYGLPVTVSRCPNNYGKNQFPEKLIPLMINNALSDKPLGLYGDGKNMREWLYVDDHCEAVDLIIHKGRLGEVYNIGGGFEISNIDLVKLLCEMLGVSESRIEFIADRKGHDRRYATDCSKIKNELGWSEKTKFSDGIKTTVDWYVKNIKQDCRINDI